MSDIAPKSDDQIAKDKEAVKAMTGAKQAMEAALRRIELLEGALSSIRTRSDEMSKAFGGDIYVNFYDRVSGNMKPTRSKELFGAINETINKVL